MGKEWEQKLEWLQAQEIEISVDLFAAAKQHLHFLKIVDKNPWLYHGPLLERAIYRYKAYWLPLLAKYDESSPICEGPLVPPFDCEWVWHCHRLNPVRYKLDCEQLYGRVLDNAGVVSSTTGSCKLQTENLWKRLYPVEPYDLDVDEAISKPDHISTLEKCTTYDLVSAVKRQSSFYNNISRAHVNNDVIVQEAVGRYKAFIYLTKRNHEKSINLMSVPTLDIDLIWHTHQLNPSSYYKDMEKMFGNILDHDDTDSDKGNGKKLDNVFSGTTAQWEETFGQSYWKPNVETPTVMIAKCAVACAKCRAEVAEKHGAGAKCRAEVVGAKCRAEVAGAKFRAEVAEKHGAGAKCRAEVAGAKCRAEVAGAKCRAEVAEKHGAGAKFRAEVAGAKCRAEVAGAKCCAGVAEKHGAGAKCRAEVAGAKCRAEVAGAKCRAGVAEKHGAGAKCRAKVAENQSVDVWSSCIADCVVSIVVKKQDEGSECFVEDVEKNSAGARCCCKVAEKNTTIYCFAVVAEKNGGCGNVMKNGVVAA